MSLPANKYEQQIIQTENELWGDIVVLNLRDSYYKLTIQMLMSFEWVHRHCSNSKMVYKADDDTYINLAMLEEIISNRFKGNVGIRRVRLEIFTSIFLAKPHVSLQRALSTTLYSKMKPFVSNFYNSTNLCSKTSEQNSREK